MFTIMIICSLVFNPIAASTHGAPKLLTVMTTRESRGVMDYIQGVEM